MNDINIISKINSQAAQRDIPDQVAAGRFVVAEYAGLHYVNHTVFNDKASADLRVAEVNSDITQRAVLHIPT